MRRLNGHDNAQVLHLRIVHHFVDRFTGACGTSAAPQAFHPVRQRLAREAGIELYPQGVVLGNAPFAGVEARVGSEFGDSSAATQAGPEFFQG